MFSHVTHCYRTDLGLVQRVRQVQKKVLAWLQGAEGRPTKLCCCPWEFTGDRKLPTWTKV